MDHQRIAEPAPEPDNGQSWRPDGVPFPDGTPHAGTDRYVAVHRLDEDRAPLIVAPWPVVDPQTGRLAFLPGDERTTAVVDIAPLQTRVDRERGGGRRTRHTR